MTHDHNAHFLTWCLAFAATNRDAVFGDLKKRVRPVWEDLIQGGAIVEVRAFEQLHSIQETDALPPWPLLLIQRLAPDNAPEAALRTIAAALQAAGGWPSGITVRRAELLRATKGSDLPPVRPTDPEAIVYKIEYIECLPDGKAQYLGIMETYDGAAKTLMIADGFMHDFVGMETLRVVEAEPGLPDWNVIHVMGLDDAEKVAQLPQQFDEKLRRLNPAWRHSELYGDLPQLRVKHRHIIGRALPELAL